MDLPTLPRIKRPAHHRSVVGLDIEPGAVRAVQASVAGGRLVVEQAVSAALEPGVVRDGEVVDAEALTETLRTLFESHKLDRRVRIGVANQRIVVRHLLLPPITDAKQVETAVRFLAAEELPMPIDQAVLDHVALGIVDTPDGPRLRVLVVAARRAMIESLLQAARAAGLRPQGIDLSAFAMVRALGAASDEGVLHLAVGGVVNLAVTSHGECVFTRVVGGGMEAMAIELAERQAISIDAARAALLQVHMDPDRPVRVAAVVAEAEVAGPEPELGPEPEPVQEPERDVLADEAHQVLAQGVRRMVGEVRNSLDFHLGAQMVEPGADAPTVKRVVLTGTATGVDGFAATLASRLSIPVDVGGVDGVDPADRGLFAVAAGLTVAEAPA
jgi:type IV pilus assembly protein PilM